MSRYRTSAPRPAPYITPEGYQRLQTELKAFWRKRDEVRNALAAAAAEGDRSENAEYIYRKKELREIDRRIHYLQKRLPELRVVRAEGGDTSRVYFGAWVTLALEGGEEVRYRIVGADELDPEHGYISVDSPLARSLLKRSVDEEVTVRTKDRTVRYVLLEIEY